MLKVAASFLCAGIPLLSGCVAGAFLLSGCANGVGTQTTETPAVPATQGIHGKVYGGNQPVAFASIYVYVPGTTGYGATATILGSTSTDANGNFNITGLYTCPASNPQVYISSIGGNPGAGNNSALYLVAATTDCNTLKANAATEYIVINEVTTVAAAYALNRFVNTANGFIGSYGYATTGLVNAFLTANNLVDLSTGQPRALTVGGNGAVPQAEINTLADIIAPCANSTGSSSAACTTLFTDTAISPPLNTWLAAVAIAQHPGTNVATLYSLAGATPPFQPALASAPNDWTVALNFDDGGTGPVALAIDANGYIYVANDAALTILDPTGLPVHGVHNLPLPSSCTGEPTAGALDTSGNFYIGMSGGQVCVYNTTTQTFPSPLSGPGSVGGVTVAPDGGVFASDASDITIWEFSSGRTVGTFPASMNRPGPIVSDVNSNISVGDQTSVTRFNNIGNVINTVTTGGVTSPSALVSGVFNNTFVVNSTTGAMAEINPFGSVLSPSVGYPLGGSSSTAITTDGFGNLIVFQGTNNFNAYNSSGVAIYPILLQSSYLNKVTSAAVDGSGGVWTTSPNGSPYGVTVILGLAGPAINPTQLALKTNQVGNRAGTINHLNFLTNALPLGILSGPFSAPIYLSGGDSGAVNCAATGLPSALTIASGTGTSCLITGTLNTAGPVSVNVTATDKQNPNNTVSKTFTVTSTVPPLGGEPQLSGRFKAVLDINKFFTPGSSSSNAFYTALVLLAIFDGNGNVSGVATTNGSSTAATVVDTPVSGKYNFLNGRGEAQLTFGTGDSYEMLFSGGGFNGTTYKKLNVTLFTPDETSAGGGVADLVDSTAWTASTLQQGFVFSSEGDLLSSSNPTNNIAGAGALTINGSNVVGGTGTFATYGQLYNPVAITGSVISAPDANGRGTITLNLGSTIFPTPPSHFEYDIVNGSLINLLSTDPGAANSVLTARLLLQTAPPVFTGNDYVLRTQTLDDRVLSAIDEGLWHLHSVFANTFSSAVDENAGNLRVRTELNAGTVTITPDPTNGGQDIATGIGSIDPANLITYWADSNSGVGVMVPAGSSSGTGTAVINKQTVSVFACPSPGVTESVGTGSLLVPSSITSGILSFSSGGSASGTYTLDQISPISGLTIGNVGTIICAGDSLTATTGREAITVGGVSEAALPVDPNTWSVESLQPVIGADSLLYFQNSFTPTD